MRGHRRRKLHPQPCLLPIQMAVQFQVKMLASSHSSLFEGMKTLTSHSCFRGYNKRKCEEACILTLKAQQDSRLWLNSPRKASYTITTTVHVKQMEGNMNK